MKTPIEATKEIIDKIAYLNIATVTKEGRPWNTAVWFAKDNHYNLYFVSPKTTVHAKNIELNNACFVTIYDSTAPEGEGVGVYIDAKVKKVTSAIDVATAIKFLYISKKNKRQITEFISTAPWRIYKITPTKIWINDAKEKDGLYLDYRVDVSLDALINS